MHKYDGESIFGLTLPDGTRKDCYGLFLPADKRTESANKTRSLIARLFWEARKRGAMGWENWYDDINCYKYMTNASESIDGSSGYWTWEFVEQVLHPKQDYHCITGLSESDRQALIDSIASFETTHEIYEYDATPEVERVLAKYA